MSDQAITDMNYDEFQSVMDGFIDRSSQESGEMPASTFFELLFAQMTERVTETIEVVGEVVNNRLVLQLPADLESTVHVKNNEILIGGQRIVVKLKDSPVYPTAY